MIRSFLLKLIKSLLIPSGHLSSFMGNYAQLWMRNGFIQILSFLKGENNFFLPFYPDWKIVPRDPALQGLQIMGVFLLVSGCCKQQDCKLQKFCIWKPAPVPACSCFTTICLSKKKKRIKNPYTLEVFNSMNLHRHLQASKTSCSFMTEGIGISGLSVQEFVGTHKFSLFWPQLEME